MLKILALDPGGTTGIYFQNGAKEKFLAIKSPWKQTYQEVKNLVQKEQIDLIIYENTNYIYRKTKDGLNLFRLLGALECLPLDQIESIPVHQVKELSQQLFKGTKKLAEIEFKPGRGKGWIFKGHKISLHCLEAYLVYYLWKEKGGKHAN